MAREEDDYEYLRQLQNEMDEHRDQDHVIDDWMGGWFEYMGEDEGYISDWRGGWGHYTSEDEGYDSELFP